MIEGAGDRDHEVSCCSSWASIFSQAHSSLCVWQRGQGQPQAGPEAQVLWEPGLKNERHKELLKKLPLPLTLVSPLPGLCSLASVEEPWQATRAVKDINNERKHTLFNLGDRKSTSGGNELECHHHKVRQLLELELGR